MCGSQLSTLWWGYGSLVHHLVSMGLEMENNLYILLIMFILDLLLLWHSFSYFKHTFRLFASHIHRRSGSRAIT